MVTKVLEARLRKPKQTVETVKENTVKPYMLAYLESMRFKDKSKIHEIVDNVVKMHEGKELPLEIQRFVFLDKTGIVNPETATKSLSKEFKERFFNDNSVIKKVIEEIFLSKTEDYPEYISIDLILNTYESKRLDLQKSRPQLLIDYSKESTPNFTQMMRFIIKLLKHEKKNRLQTELFKNSHFVLYYQTLTKFFEEEKTKSLRKEEFEQLKEIKNTLDEKLRLVDGNDEFWTRFTRPHIKKIQIPK